MIKIDKIRKKFKLTLFIGFLFIYNYSYKPLYPPSIKSGKYNY